MLDYAGFSFHSRFQIKSVNNSKDKCNPNRSRWSVRFLVGEGEPHYENSEDLLENTCYMLAWQGISDVIKEKQIVINAIVTLIIYIDW